jgi:hypothetical protein
MTLAAGCVYVRLLCWLFSVLSPVWFLLSLFGKPLRQDVWILQICGWISWSFCPATLSLLRGCTRRCTLTPLTLPLFAAFACRGSWILFTFLSACPPSIRVAVCSIIASYVLLVGASVDDAAVPVGDLPFAAELVPCCLQPLSLPPSSRVAGVAPPCSAPLGARRGPRFAFSPLFSMGFLSNSDSEGGIANGNFDGAAVSPLFELLHQSSGNLATLKACCFVCTTLCTVLGQMKHQKRASLLTTQLLELKRCQSTS